MTRRDLEQRYADKSTTPLPSPEQLRELMRTCSCGAGYLDLDAGRDSHEIVFGHRPYSAGPPTDPAGRGTLPTTHQSAAPRNRDPTTDPGHNDERDDDGK